MKYALSAFALLLACGPAATIPDAGGPDASDPAPDAPEDAAPTGPIALSVEPTGARVSRAIVAAEGGTLVLEGEGGRYTLEITPDALAADTEITVEEVRILEIPGAHAVRFSPDGLVFQVPALLSVDAPYDQVMLAVSFHAGTPGVELDFAAPHEGGLSMAVAHFSEAGFLPSSGSANAVDPAQAAMVAEVARVEASMARGVVSQVRQRIRPMIERIRLGVGELEVAARALAAIRSDVMLADVGHVIVPGGSETVDDIVNDAVERFEMLALALYADRTMPRCAPGRDTVGVTGWVESYLSIRASLALLGIDAPEAEPCVTARISATWSPTALAAATSEIVIETLSLELVGPGAMPETAPLEGAIFEFSPTGATGPMLREAPTGSTTDVRFSRPATDRPPVVQIVVTASSTDTRFGALSAPRPLTILVAEPAVYVGFIEAGYDCSTLSPARFDCPGSGGSCSEVLDIDNYRLSGTVRLSDALGPSPTVEVTDPSGLHYVSHEICEYYAPRTADQLTAANRASATRRSDGTILLTVCGTTSREVTREDYCGVEPRSETTSTMDSCFMAILRPDPATGIPTRFVPESIESPCGSTVTFGELVPE